ncbi:ATP-binding cassette domain-containing protein [Arthrobacter alpinus]|nr:ATP-binding cassette domain-containing protein [Arthrobacter alpinus]
MAIVGPTGAGKTTLVNLLMRFYEIDSGTITVDGVNTAHLSRDDLRSQFGMVLQDAWLFGGTIRRTWRTASWVLPRRRSWKRPWQRMWITLSVPSRMVMTRC